MRFLKLLLSLVVVFLTTTNSSQAAPQQIYEGAGFTITQPEGFDVRESFNGQIYTMELRRDNTDDDESFAALRLLYVPNAAAQVPAEGLVEMLVGEIQTHATAQTLTVQSQEEVRRVIAGEERVGQKLVLKSSFAVAEYEAYGYHWNGHLLGVISKVSYSEQERIAAALELVLKDFVAHEFTTESQRQVQHGNFRFMVPALLPEGREEVEGGLILRLGYPEGVLELNALDSASVSNLSAMDAWFEDNRNAEVKKVIEAAGGQYLRNRWTSVWAGEGLLTGTRMDLVAADGNAIHVYSYFLRALTHGLTVNFQCTPESRDAMTTHLAQLMSSFTAPGLEAKLRDGLGSPNLCQNKGLSFFYPNNLWLNFVDGEVPRFTLMSLHSELRTHFQVLFDLHAEPLGEGGLLQELHTIVEQYYPGATLGESWQIGGRVFNVQREGLALVFTYQEEEYQINALSAPHRGGEVVTAVTCCSADANAALWIFANLHGRFMDLEDGPRYISSKDARITFDPAEWSALLTSTPIGNEFTFKQRNGKGEVEMKIEAWNHLQPTDKFPSLAARASKEFASRRKAGLYNPETSSVAQGYSTQSSKTVMCTLGGGIAARNTILGGVEGEQLWEFTTWAARLDSADVKIRATAPAEDAAAKEAITALLDSLVFENTMQYPADTVVQEGLSLSIPAGYLWSVTPGEDGRLDVEDAFRETRSFTLHTVAPYDPIKIEDLYAMAVESMHELSVAQYGGAMEESQSMIKFLNKPVPLFRYGMHNEKGGCEAVVWIVVAVEADTYFQFVIAMSPEDETEIGVDGIVAMISAAELVAE